MAGSRGRLPRANNPIVCTCLTVRESEIVAAIRAGASTVAEVGAHCEAGTGCHTCHPAILLLLEDEVHRQLAIGEAPDPLRQLGLFDRSAIPRGPGGAARRPGRREQPEPDGDDETTADPSPGPPKPQPDSAE